MDCSVEDDNKFDCLPDSAPETEERCLARGCCWKAINSSSEFPINSYPPLNTPCCYYPSNYVGYNLTTIEWHRRGLKASLQRVRPSGFADDIESVTLRVRFYRGNMLRIQLKDSKRERYEVAVPNIYDSLRKSERKYDNRPFRTQYGVQLKNDGDLIVQRLTSQQVIFHTNLSTLVFSDQFLQLSSILPSHYIYGLGQHKASLLRSTSWKQFKMLNRDRGPVENENLYGSHPFYLAMEADGKANGVLLFNSNPMDVVLQPTPAITYRPIGGILDLFIFLGPTPDEVVQQYTSLIGRPFLPPYWSLGFHLCKYNYSTLDHTKVVWNRTRAAGIPFDTQWNDIDYMVNQNDFTYDKTRFKGLPEFVKELHKEGMHYVPITDPGISNTEPTGTYPPYDEGEKMNVFVKNSTGQIFVGKVWNKGTTVFPDFTHPKASDYWTKQFQRYHLEVAIDGAWIDMNEPSNFYNGQVNGCPNSTLNNPQYLPGGDEPLYTRTLCMTAKHYYTFHYNVHNLYAVTEAIATYKALSTIRKKRPFIISRSSFPGLGQYSGNWNGDASSSWDDMRWSIVSVLDFNMFGIPMVGADICGFEGNTTVELCARWSALGAFYPFSRNHNANTAIEQDPVALGPRVITSAKEALTTRYFLLPYLYTLFYRSHLFGDTVARPLFFEYPDDVSTYAIDRQFLWGRSLMVVPVLDSGVTEVTAYFPNDTWYDYYTGREYETKASDVKLNASTDRINLAIRGGSIIPAQLPSTTTTESRLNEFSLIVALKPEHIAFGELFWDDGDSIDSITKRSFSNIQFLQLETIIFTSPHEIGFKQIPPLDSIKILGCHSSPNSVTANQIPVTFDYDSDNKILTISKLNLSFLERNIIQWEYAKETEDTTSQ